jgi:hypothetical protein
MDHFKTFDVVALLHDLPDRNMIKGQVGTIVEKLDDNVFEVEFCGKNGETIALETLKAGDLFLLRFELTGGNLSLH